MKRTRDIKRLFIAIMLLMVHPAASHAFGLSGWGGKVGLLDPEGASSGPAISAHLEYDQPGTAWHILPSVMFWDSNRMSGLSGNFDMYYHFVPEGVATPYLGAGMGVHHFEFDGTNSGSTRLGLNLFGGLRIPTRAGHVFLEGRHTSSRVSQTSLLGGITFLSTR
jgi:hypothetical protein